VVTQIDAIVVLPDHLHCVWTLPPGDGDFSTRWHDIKARFLARIPQGERLSARRTKKGERGIRQRRFREYVVRDERDLEPHVDYIHYVSPDTDTSKDPVTRHVFSG